MIEYVVRRFSGSLVSGAAAPAPTDEEGITLVTLTPTAPAKSTGRSAGGELSVLGVAPDYVDAFGRTQVPSAATRQRLRDCLADAAAVAREPLVVAPGRCDARLHGLLLLEDGTSAYLAGRLDVVGYHHLVGRDGAVRLVLVAPERLPEPTRGFGVAVQLYAARTRGSWGIGDFADLARIATEVGGQGARTLLVSPVHAMAPTLPAPNSPYSPASRLWLNVLHLAVDDVPGADRVDLSAEREAGLALNATRRIDRNAVWRTKTGAVAKILSGYGEHPPEAFLAWRAEQGGDLEAFAGWSAIAELYGADWRAWPPGLRHPRSPAVQQFAAEHAERLTFHAFCQWAADLQLAAACAGPVDVCLDVAVGFDLPSADAWLHQDLLCPGFEVGCPADRNNIDGQRWGLPPFSPHALVNADLGPFVAMVRASLRHAGALRIDHVMQLWRLFWIPRDGTCREGAYVNYPVEALLAVLRIEAWRAGAWVVGEDLGTLVPGARARMRDIGMLGYRSATRTAPELNDEPTIGASSTHDQTTVAGLLTGQDMANMASIGKPFDPAQYEAVRSDLATLAGVRLDRPVGTEEVAAAVRAQYARLSAGPSRIVLASLDDLAAVAERPNMPGTVDQWPNWRIALPLPVEDVLADTLAVGVLSDLATRRAPQACPDAA